MSDHDAQVLAVLREQEAAIAGGNAQGVIAPMASNVVLYDLPPLLEHRGDIARHASALKDWFATWVGSVTTELSQPTVVVDGNLAVVFGLSHMRGCKIEGGIVDAWNRRTVVLQRSESSGWRIIHDHSSYPMEMDGSGRAAVDLKPNAV